MTANKQINMTEAQKRKVLAAAEIVEMGDLAILKKLIEFQDYIDEFKFMGVDAEALTQKLDAIKKHCDDNIGIVSDEIKSTITDFSRLIEQLDTRIGGLQSIEPSQIYALSDKISKEVIRLESLIPMPVDMSAHEARLAEIESRIPQMPEKDTPIEVRNKLESIQDEKEKLRIDAIKDLRNELDELRRKISTAKGITIFGGGTGGGHVVKAHDLSPSLNGVLKTFPLPAFWRVISVTSSSAPFSFRPTTDYTTSGTTITFTSEIEASTTLASGQTIIITYSE